MKFTYFLFPVAAIAIPASPLSCVSKNLIYNPACASPIFENTTCTLSKKLILGQVLVDTFPTVAALGQIFGPIIIAAIGDNALNQIDSAADALCVNAQQDPTEGSGACQNTLQAVNDFINDKDPTGQVEKFRCLLDLLCIANAGFSSKGICQILLTNADCIANRIVGASDIECD